MYHTTLVIVGFFHIVILHLEFPLVKVFAFE
uniref:Uncharacterized protein n=1 Tax=Rhizophora mucronata TaxID=61149 RepID=A0A2P2QFG6_RHIMU